MYGFRNRQVSNSKKFHSRASRKKIDRYNTKHRACIVQRINQRKTDSNGTMDAATTALGVANDSDLRVPCYCEENVWRLAYRMLHGEQKQEDLQYHVVFVSNPQKCCLFLYQRCNDDPFDPCFWDYHVILLCTKSNDVTMVQDIDSHLPYKISLKDYLKHVFPTLPEDAKRFSPYFR